MLIDIPIGKTAKVMDIYKAEDLKKKFERIGKGIGMEITVLISDGKEPIGNGIGPLHEALDVLAVLKNEEGHPEDLREKALVMAGLIFEMANVAAVETLKKRFPDVVVGAGAKVRRAIIEKGVKIPPGFEIGYDVEKDRKRFTVSESGVVVIAKATVIKK